MTDFIDPPEDPPEQCVDPTMWAIARELFSEHEPVDGTCESCETADLPCAGRTLADQGLQTSCGAQMPTTDFWSHLLRIKVEQSSR